MNHPVTGDYLVIENHNLETSLVQVLKARQNEMLVIQQEGRHLPGRKKTATIKLEQVVLNLGKKPRQGHVFGVDVVDLFTKTKTHDIVGDVHFFYAPSKDVFNSLWSAFNIVHQRLRKHRLGRLLDDDIHWEIYSESGGGKYSGMYKRVRTEEIPYIKIRPEKLKAPQYPYVIAHELGHHLHYTYLQDNHQLNTSWLKLYQKSIHVEPVNKQSCRELFEYCESRKDEEGLTINALRKGLDDVNKQTFNRILSYIRSNHSLTPANLDTFIASFSWDNIESVWPTQVTKKDLDPLVSQYACVSVDELFAESFAYYINGISLPKSVTNLIERTIEYSRAVF